MRKPFSTITIIFVVILALMSFALVELGSGTATVLAQDNEGLSGKNIYFSSANGEPSRFDRSTQGISRLGGMLSQLGMEVSVFEWNLGIPQDADVIVILGPTTALSPDQVARLWLYLNGGGRVLLASDPIGDFEAARGVTNAFQEFKGFFELSYPDFGLSTRDEVLFPGAQELADVAETNLLVSDSDKNRLNVDMTFEQFGDSPILDGISQVYMSGVQSLEVDVNTPGMDVVPLVFATNQYIVAKSDLNIYLRDAFSADDDNTSDIELQWESAERIVAATLEISDSSARMVFVGDLDLFLNGGGFVTEPYYSSNFVHPDNIRFATNLIAWLTESPNPEIAIDSAEAAATPTIVPSPEPTAES